MITDGDKVKILDFGLAKALLTKRRPLIRRTRYAHGDNDAAGVILGTAHT